MTQIAAASTASLQSKEFKFQEKKSAVITCKKTMKFIATNGLTKEHGASAQEINGISFFECSENDDSCCSHRSAGAGEELSASGSH
jgi:hypothetical protein